MQKNHYEWLPNSHFTAALFGSVRNFSANISLQVTQAAKRRSLHGYLKTPSNVFWGGLNGLLIEDKVVDNKKHIMLFLWN